MSKKKNKKNVFLLFFEYGSVFEFLLFAFIPLRHGSHVTNDSAVYLTFVCDEMFTVMADPCFSVFVCTNTGCFFSAFIAGHFRRSHVSSNRQLIFNIFQ